MNYKEFDNERIIGKERENAIIKALKDEPKKIIQLIAMVRLPRHCVCSCLRQMQNKGIVNKKRVGVQTYFGLTKKFRK